MALWKENLATKPGTMSMDNKDPVRAEPMPMPAVSDFVPAASAAAPAPKPRLEPERVRKESLIASDLTIEGKIEGSGSVRIAGKFNGDVNVQGDLTIESGAKLTGAVRANVVIVAGELEGNIEGAVRVDLQQSGVITGDVKAGSLTVAAGARMRGQAVFGWEDERSKGNRSDGGNH